MTYRQTIQNIIDNAEEFGDGTANYSKSTIFAHAKEAIEYLMEMHSQLDSDEKDWEIYGPEWMSHGDTDYAIVADTSTIPGVKYHLTVEWVTGQDSWGQVAAENIIPVEDVARIMGAIGRA
jgi:hypothetical protein